MIFKMLCPLFLGKTLVRRLKDFVPYTRIEPIGFPKNEEDRKLKAMDHIPYFAPGEDIDKGRKEKYKLRGPELIHNTLLHKQYGVIALYPGYFKGENIDAIREKVNTTMNTFDCFAVWRIEPPYKPITRHGGGKKLGGGKGSIDHYVTPVKANRVILEVGGYIPFAQVERMLREVAYLCPVPAKAVSQQMLDEFETEKKRIKDLNRNPFTWEYVVKNNMLNCMTYLNQYDIEFSKYGPIMR
ncbi:hypothetical protein ACOME3_004585 [Neoechinorhynchus agilis]